MNMQYKSLGEWVAGVLDQAMDGGSTGDTAAGELTDEYDLCSDPTQYEWHLIGRKEMLVPYNAVRMQIAAAPRSTPPLAMQPSRWERHDVLIVEGRLRRGESNILPRRCFYIDERSWLILLGEGYDISGVMSQCFLLDSYVTSPARARGRWYQL